MSITFKHSVGFWEKNRIKSNREKADGRTRFVFPFSR